MSTTSNNLRRVVFNGRLRGSGSKYYIIFSPNHIIVVSQIREFLGCSLQKYFNTRETGLWPESTKETTLKRFNQLKQLFFNIYYEAAKA